MTEPFNRRELGILVLIIGLTVLRLALAPFIPLAFDEAYYWRWSIHLAPGYYDHPPMVAIWIAAGRAVFGDTQLGVRVVFILSALPASWTVWRAAAILIGNRPLAATAVLFFNLTLFVSVGTAIATPDTPLLLAAAFVTFFLAKLVKTGKGAWWLAIGAAVAFGLLSKYTALFWGVSVLVAVVLLPELRRWLLTPWPWASGVLAFALFTPTILWNAAHDWISFRLQFGRAGAAGFHLQYAPDYFGAIFGMATPSIFVLAVMGLVAIGRGQGAPRSTRVVLGALIWPIALYFLWHALHARVQGNWTAPIFPGLAIIAAIAVHAVDWPVAGARLARFSARLAAPVALGFAGIVYLQAVTGFLPIGPRDPTARILAAGMTEVVDELEELRATTGAKGVLTFGYGLTGWLSFYLPRVVPVVEIDQRYRWLQEPDPSRELMAGPLLYIVKEGNGTQAIAVYSRIDDLGQLTRRRGTTAIETYHVFAVSAPAGDPLDRRSPRPR